MKKILKKFLVISAIAIAIAIAAVIAWEQVRTPIINWYSGEEATWERPVEEPTEFELYRNTPEAIEANQLMFDRKKLEEAEAELEAKEAELEQQKEELRAKELELSSLL